MTINVTSYFPLYLFDVLKLEQSCTYDAHKL